MSTSTAWGGDIPVDLQAKLFYKVLAYDTALPGRGAESTLILVFDAATTGERRDCEAAFSPLQGRSVQDVALSVTSVDVADDATLEAAKTAGAVLYLPAGSRPETLAAAVATGVPIVAGSEALARGGGGVGFGEVSGRPRIFVNLPSSKAQGSRFSPDLFRVATVIR